MVCLAYSRRNLHRGHFQFPRLSYPVAQHIGVEVFVNGYDSFRHGAKSPRTGWIRPMLNQGRTHFNAPTPSRLNLSSPARVYWLNIIWGLFGEDTKQHEHLQRPGVIIERHADETQGHPHGSGKNVFLFPPGDKHLGRYRAHYGMIETAPGITFVIGNGELRSPGLTTALLLLEHQRNNWFPTNRSWIFAKPRNRLP